MRNKAAAAWSDQAQGGLSRRSFISAMGVGLLLVTTACGDGDAAGNEKVELSYRIWDKNQQPAMQQIVDKFQAANPNINVNIQVTPVGRVLDEAAGRRDRGRRAGRVLDERPELRSSTPPTECCCRCRTSSRTTASTSPSTRSR